MVSPVFQKDSRWHSRAHRGGVGQADKETNEMEDAAMFFAHVFGGERFKDYVRPSISPGFVCRLSQ